eukprot:gene28582-36863_t
MGHCLSYADHNSSPTARQGRGRSTAAASSDYAPDKLPADMLRSVAPGINTNCTKLTVTGSISNNEPAALAQNRARAVFDALVKYGIDAKRLVMKTNVPPGQTSSDQDETALQRADIAGIDAISEF